MRVHTIWAADHMALSTEEHTHDFFQLVCCKKGGGAYLLNGVEHPAVPNHWFLIRPGQPHCTRLGEQMQLVEIQFLTEDRRLTEHLFRLPEEFVLAEDLSIRTAIQDLIREVRSRSLFSDAAADAALTQLLIRILRAQLDIPEPPQAPAIHGDAQFLRILDFIDQNLDQPLTLEILAAQAHFSKAYLAEQFKSRWGISPMRYITQLRVEKAKDLLSMTDLPVSAIAEQLGFQTPQYFCRVFKEKEGVTPQSYRTSQRERSIPHGTA